MTDEWEEKDCASCEHVEKDPREEPCLHCGILRNGFEPRHKDGDGK